MTLVILYDGMCQITAYHASFTIPLQEILSNEK